MTIEIKDGRYFSAIWSIGGSAQPWDVLAALFRNDDGRWQCDYRFRYYDGDQSKDAFENGDTKSWYQVTFADGTGEKLALERVGEMWSILAKESGQEVDCLHVRSSNPNELHAALQRAPWAHMRTFGRSLRSRSRERIRDDATDDSD